MLHIGHVGQNSKPSSVLPARLVSPADLHHFLPFFSSLFRTVGSKTSAFVSWYFVCA